MTNARIRPAVAADIPDARAVADAAFRPCIARIGAVPVPMEAGHAANVASGRVFVAELPDDGGAGPARPAGLVVPEPRPDHPYPDLVAVRPDARGAGPGAAAAGVRGDPGTGARTALVMACVGSRIPGKRPGRAPRPGAQPSGHQVRAMSLRISGRSAGRSSASSRTWRVSVFLGGFCTVTRRMAASSKVRPGRPFSRR